MLFQIKRWLCCSRKTKYHQKLTCRYIWEKIIFLCNKRHLSENKYLQVKLQFGENRISQCDWVLHVSHNSYAYMTSDAYYCKLGQRYIRSTCSVFYWFFYVVRRYSFPSPIWPYNLDIHHVVFTLYNMWSSWRLIQSQTEWHTVNLLFAIITLI